MAELHSNLYFKHPDDTIHQLLYRLFSIGDLNNEGKIGNKTDFAAEFTSIASRISPTTGEQLAKKLLDTIENTYYDSFGSESIWDESGYVVSHWVNGSSGDNIQYELVAFLYDLCPDIHAQSWGCGDDDPWEYWFKFHQGQVLRFDDEPYTDDEFDAELLATVYKWWHSEMPKSVKEGFLNEEQDDMEKIEPKKISEQEYDDWLQELCEDNQQSDDYDDDEPYEEGEVEERGPELTEQQLLEIRNVCQELLALEDATISDRLNHFKPICHELVKLEKKYQSGMEIYEENAEDIKALGEAHIDYIEKSTIAPFLKEFLENIISRIHQSNMLGTMIGHFDTVVFLCSILTEMLEDKEAAEVYCQSIDSYEDFVAWKDFMLMMIDEDSEDEDREDEE